jgi:RNA polymerase sigma-70 factor (ECF subfamily)
METSGSGVPASDPTPASRSQAILRRSTSAGPDHDSTDRAIVDAVLAGDRDAFRQLVERESASVVRASHRILGDLHEAEDIAQEAFVTAYRSLASWRATVRSERG